MGLVQPASSSFSFCNNAFRRSQANPLSKQNSDVLRMITQQGVVRVKYSELMAVCQLLKDLLKIQYEQNVLISGVDIIMDYLGNMIALKILAMRYFSVIFIQVKIHLIFQIMGRLYFLLSSCIFCLQIFCLKDC